MRVVLLDGNNVAFRHFASMQLSYKGMGTGAVYGTIKHLTDLLRRMQCPVRVIAVWDGEGPTWRRTLFPQYKAQRAAERGQQGLDIEDFRRQLIELRHGLHYLGVENLWISCVEADDVVSIMAHASDCLSHECLILSSDRDFYQLLTPNVFIRNSKGEFRLQDFQEAYSITPDEWPLVRALAGDHSDNIPGVRGIGEKTALALVRRYGTLARICRYGVVSTESRERRAAERVAAGRGCVGLFLRLVRLPLREVPDGNGSVREAVRRLALGDPPEPCRESFEKLCRRTGIHSLRVDGTFDVFENLRRRV